MTNEIMSFLPGMGLLLIFALVALFLVIRSGKKKRN